MRDDSTRSRVRLAVGNILVYLVGVLVVVSAALKFAQPPAVVTQFRELGYEGGTLTFLGILEVSCALVFVVPWTRSVGLLLISSYLGGAIATHVGHGQAAAFGPA